MAKGVSISVASDTKDFLKGIKTGVIEPLEDASDTLQDLAKDGEKAGAKLEDSMKDAQRDTEKLAREFDDLGDKIRDSSRRGGQGMKDNTKDATTAAARDLEELKGEAMQNASETFSSFDGSVDSFVDGIQGTFGGIVSNMGPIGAAMGAALAIGIGLAVAKGQEVADAINEAKERAAELAAEIDSVDGDLSQIEWADKVKDWGLAIEDSREWFEFWQDDARTAFEVAAEKADEFGISVKDLALGLSGVDADAATRSIGRLGDQIDELEQKRRKADRSLERDDIDSEIRQRETLIEKLKAQGNVTEEAIELNKLSAEVTAELAAADKAAADAAQARTDAESTLQSELDAGVASWQEYIDKETEAADPSAYIAGMAERAAATSNFNGNVQLLAQEFKLSADETQAILDQGLDFAPMLQAILDSGMSAQFVEQIQAAVGGGQEILNGTELGATVTAVPDTDAASAALGEAAQDRETTIEADSNAAATGKALDTAAKDRTTTIRARADTSAASRALSALAARPRTARIGAYADLSAARAAINSFVNQPRTAVVTVVARTPEGKPVP